MVIPDMLKNAPMFKRLDAKIKVGMHVLVSCLSPGHFHFQENKRGEMHVFVLLYSSFFLGFLKGKGAALGVGRGRAAAMRARVRFCYATLLINNGNGDDDNSFMLVIKLAHLMSFHFAC